MKDGKIAEGRAAWRKFQAPAPRGVIDYRPEVLRTERAKSRFRQRVTFRDATGCWVWGGPVTYEGHPVTYQWNPATAHNAKRSAFLWMIENWFPDARFSDRTRATAPTCGESRCISPFHRRGRTFAHITKLTSDQVRQIFSLRDQAKMADVAEQFGVSVSLVSGIWAGKHHSNVTGQWEIRKNPRKLTPTQVREVYALKGRAKQQAVADSFGVSRSTVRHIWEGVTWTEVTGASLLREQAPC